MGKFGIMTLLNDAFSCRIENNVLIFEVNATQFGPLGAREVKLGL